MTLIEPIPQNKVLVTGANGYLALWIIYDLLEKGFSVRGTVRSEEKGKWLDTKFSNYSDRFQWITVEDITKEGAFDEAVKDVVAIEHVASPLSPGGTDPDLFIKPAVEGTLGILKSALNFGKKVKRIIITSSCAAIIEDSQDPVQIWDESNWGDVWVEKTKAQGSDAPYMFKYRASKTLAERAAWRFYEQHKETIDWDIVTLQPPFILGGSHLDTSKPEHLTSSLHGLYHNIFDAEKALKAGNGSFSYVHAKDISRVHVDALNEPAAGGQRIIVSAGTSTWAQARDVIANSYPELVRDGILPSLEPETAKEAKGASGGIDYSTITMQVNFRNNKSKEIFGIEYRSFQSCIEDCVEDFKKRGFLVKKSEK
ncbi:NAD(P)-binding protein [Panaeolus papilionaceus]|nr:NAD(P)-binding protein [Panaeolus papilionaceus]